MSLAGEDARLRSQDVDILRKRAESLATEAEEYSAREMMSVLLFRLGDEWYGTDIEGVREILQEYTITPLPCVPRHILGVVNVRGEIVSVTDPAMLMGVAGNSAITPEHPLILVQNGTAITALVVDEAGDIVEAERDSIEAPVATIGRQHAEYISGHIFDGGRLVGLLNLDRVLEPIGERS